MDTLTLTVLPSIRAVCIQSFFVPSRAHGLPCQPEYMYVTNNMYIIYNMYVIHVKHHFTVLDWVVDIVL